MIAAGGAGRRKLIWGQLAGSSLAVVAGVAGAGGGISPTNKLLTNNVLKALLQSRTFRSCLRDMHCLACLAVARMTASIEQQPDWCLQGRVACEISSGDELITTELIFSGVLTGLTPEEAAALLSALVFQVRGGPIMRALQFHARQAALERYHVVHKGAVINESRFIAGCCVTGALWRFSAEHRSRPQAAIVRPL